MRRTRLHDWMDARRALIPVYEKLWMRGFGFLFLFLFRYVCVTYNFPTATALDGIRRHFIFFEPAAKEERKERDLFERGAWTDGWGNHSMVFSQGKTALSFFPLLLSSCFFIARRRKLDTWVEMIT